MKQAKFHIDTKTKALLYSGAIGGTLFVLTFLIEGVIRNGYDPLRHPISSLSIGGSGWIQIANFIITGILMSGFAIGLRRVLKSSKGGAWGPLLIGTAAIGLIGAGIFTTDPVYGYPQDQPLILAQFTVHGHLHDLCSILVFICLPVACFVFRSRFVSTGERGWATYSAITGIAMFMTFILAGMGFKQFPGLVDLAGVFQRLSIMTGWAWLTLLALYSLRTTT